MPVVGERRWSPTGTQMVTGILIGELLVASGFVLWPPAVEAKGVNITLTLIIAIFARLSLRTWKGCSSLVWLEVLVFAAWFVPISSVAFG